MIVVLDHFTITSDVGASCNMIHGTHNNNTLRGLCNNGVHMVILIILDNVLVLVLVVALCSVLVAFIRGGDAFCNDIFLLVLRNNLVLLLCNMVVFVLAVVALNLCCGYYVVQWLQWSSCFVILSLPRTRCRRDVATALSPPRCHHRAAIAPRSVRPCCHRRAATTALPPPRCHRHALPLPRYFGWIVMNAGGTSDCTLPLGVMSGKNSAGCLWGPSAHTGPR